MLLKYRPQMEGSSKLLNAYQINNLSEHMIYLRSMKWVLLYRLSEHGVSLHTFIKRLSMYDNTLLVMEDKQGWKFGGLASEEWAKGKDFYGTGDSFVFTFKKGDQIELWQSTGQNSMYQYCDKGGFGMGGGFLGGRFALYVGDDFWRGSSTKTECFDNECLSSSTDFNLIDMEVWGFE